MGVVTLTEALNRLTRSRKGATQALRDYGILPWDAGLPTPDAL